MRVDLPSGNWVELRDPKTITERQRRPARLALTKTSPAFRAASELGADAPVGARMSDVINAEDTVAMYELNDIIAAGMITQAAPDLGLPDPVTSGSLQDLDGKDYDAILEATAPFFPYFMGRDPNTPDPDPESPTGPSNA